MPKISILMYHQVGEFARPNEHRATFCHVRRFKAQMAWLHRFGYRVISLSEALAGLYSGRRLPGHSVVLTFDDGYQNFYEYAFPLLKRYGFSATVFLVAGLIGQKAEWLEKDGRFGPELMASDTIRKLVHHRITFGSHTVTHPRLTQIPPSERIHEIAASKALIEGTLGEAIDHFCYPGGDLNRRVVEDVKAAGYKSGLSCIRGSATAQDDPFVLPRKAISYGDTIIGFLWKLHAKHRKKNDPQELLENGAKEDDQVLENGH